MGYRLCPTAPVCRRRDVRVSQTCGPTGPRDGFWVRSVCGTATDQSDYCCRGLILDPLVTPTIAAAVTAAAIQASIHTSIPTENTVRGSLTIGVSILLILKLDCTRLLNRSRV